LSLREIGQELYLSPNTVKTHARAAYRKLGVSTRPDAIARAHETGVLLMVRQTTAGGSGGHDTGEDCCG
jgi:ATP/maltotriose-dependent transcriptional regulator MalT